MIENKHETKKPYSQYVGKFIVFDRIHKHLILKAEKYIVDGYVKFETVCISYISPIRLSIEKDAGFGEDASDQELTKVTPDERYMIIKFALTGKKQSRPL